MGSILDTEEVPRPKFEIDQKVFARDLPHSSRIREAKVLLRLYSSKRLSDDNDSARTVGHQTKCCWSYNVHYQGWNKKWDHWCYEEDVFDERMETRDLAKQLRSVKVVRSNKTLLGKKPSLNGKNDAIISNEQPAQTKRKIDNVAVRNKGATCSSKRCTSSHLNVPSRKRRKEE